MPHAVWVPRPVKFLKFWRLIDVGHVKRINPFGIRLGVEVRLTRSSAYLCLNCICNQVLNFLDGYQAWRPTILEFTSFF